MNKFLYISLLFSFSCFDKLYGDTDYDFDDDDDDERREGDQEGDCTDGVDNDNDGLIDCSDSGCVDKPACDQDSSVPPPPSGMEVDGLFFYHWTAYMGGTDPIATDADGNEYVTVSSSQGPLNSSRLTVGLVDTTSSEVCYIQWAFTGSTVKEDADALPSVEDAFDANTQNDVWWAYLLEGVTPSTSGTCDNFGDEFSTGLYESLLSDTPGFGFGPLTSDISDSMQGNGAQAQAHPGGWENVKDLAFTGIWSTTALSTDGSRRYFALNEAYLYPINDGTTTWDPSATQNPQGNELTSAEAAAYAQGFYVSSNWFSVAWQQ